jgi:tetratricopeptide (TPR) repeat protein
LLAAAGRKNEAISQLMLVIEQSGDDPATGKEAAQMVRDMGSPAQAEAAYAALAGHFPADSGVWMKLGEARFDAREEASARDAFRKAVETSGQSQEAEEALARTEDALKLDPTRRGLPVRERAKRWDEMLRRVYAAAEACGSTPEMQEAQPLVKKRALSLETPDQKMEAALKIWKSTGERCKADPVLRHILAKLGQ